MNPLQWFVAGYICGAIVTILIYLINQSMPVKK